MNRRLVAIAIAMALLLPALAWRPGAAAPPNAGWWDSAWAYRVVLDVATAGYARHDKVVDVPINFTVLLDQMGEDSRFDPDSLRVLEVDGATIIDDAAPFQFDRANDYDPSGNAAGTLVILLTGATGAEETRHYHVYFDVTGSGHAAAEFDNRLTAGSMVDSYGYDSFRVTNDDGTFTYHKTGGGLASFIDTDSKDWIGWNPTARGAGDYRGIPNMVHPNDGGYFHPGRANVSSSLARRGPLKVTIRSTSLDGLWATQWEFYPDLARLTVLKTAAEKFYWLLYEGTPGGLLEPATDLVVRSDGTTTTAGESWTGDLPGEEWVTFADPALGRSLYTLHHEQDEIVDSYTPDDLGKMTIFGFGRNGNVRLLSGADRQMTVGLVDETEPAAVQAAIDADNQPLAATLGETQQRPATPTPSPSPTSEPTDTPTPSPTATKTPRPTDTPTPTPTDTPTATPTATVTATATVTGTSSPTATATATATSGPSPTPRRPAYELFLPAVRRQ